MIPSYRAAFQWQSRAVLGRHLTVYRRNWHTAALPPLLEPIILLLAFGVGLGGFIPEFAWRGRSVSYLAYLAPGMLAYTAFMTAFFQALFAAYIRMHYQKTWEGQLVTQLRLEHVVWGEVLWAAT
ncbi:MAG TPA: ABC transporter permease, partial [Candidatus Competibacter phosphatis]|nr:ABC transporter permease [Candidatus Competibacter phosphatis]HMR02904.1 ABC transporter permease [Candidatus Competibacter phosphatis]